MYYTMHDAPHKDPVSEDMNHNHEPIMSPIQLEMMDGMV